MPAPSPLLSTVLPPLPAGFTLDQPLTSSSIPPLPSGFTLDRPPSASPEGPFRGMLEPGNIDLAKRPMALTPEGDVATVRSRSFQFDDGREVLLPTVSPGGKLLSDKEAIELYKRTGQHLGIFDNADDADQYAQALHESQGRAYQLPPLPEGFKLDTPLYQGQARKGDFGTEVTKGVIRGAIESTGMVLKGAAGAEQLAKEDRRRMFLSTLDYYAKIDRGETVTGKDISDPDVFDMVEEYKNASPEQRAELRKARAMQVGEQLPALDVTKTPAYQQGQALEDFAARKFRAAKDY